jgi:hypothetical protein
VLVPEARAVAAVARVAHARRAPAGGVPPRGGPLRRGRGRGRRAPQDPADISRVYHCACARRYARLQSS